MNDPTRPMLGRLRDRLFGTTPTHEKISYAQCGEDLIMAFMLQELGIERPWYIDVGAHHPQYINNTYLFYQRGAVGVNIEPDPTLFQAFLKERPKDTNLAIGIGAEEGTAELFVFNVPTLNTFVREEAERVEAEQRGYFVTERVSVPVRTIESVMREFAPDGRVDLMSIDVEGLDETIVRSMDPNGTMPKILCIETLTFSATEPGKKRQDLIDLVLSRGYVVYADTKINTIFIQRGLGL